MKDTAVDHIEILVEEPSMEVALDSLLPKMIGHRIRYDIRRFQCKAELLKQLPSRLSGYASWLPTTSCIVVLVDRDDEDCKALKKTLDKITVDAGLTTRSNPKRNKVQVINRIAIEELEAWFFGDWAAVLEAYPRMDVNLPNKAGFRKPDQIKGGTWEALERELKKKNYFKTGLRKIECAREIAARMEPSRNTSPSFHAFKDVFSNL
ncbi:MAG: DUF4276 family protein [Cytophagales bacterium]|nr:DUF4276 family protein [Cytophagales bacterium]